MRSGAAGTVGLVLALAAMPVAAAETRVAVAANFAQPAEAIAAAFTARTGDTVAMSFGATGQLYAQITQGAPFSLFLAADDTRPAQLAAEGLAVEGSAFTYAIGRLVLYSPTIDLTDGEAVLMAGDFQHIAIADPTTAPYGAAAMATLQRLGLAQALGPKIATGESITQAQQFVDSGNAELAFLALSQVIGKPAEQFWLVPAEYHGAVRQDAVLLQAADTVARAFMEFLKGDEARTIIETYGYTLPN